MSQPSLADVLAWDALSEEARRVAGIHFQLIIEKDLDYHDGLKAGYELGYEHGYRAGRAWSERNTTSNGGEN